MLLGLDSACNEFGTPRWWSLIMLSLICIILMRFYSVYWSWTWCGVVSGARELATPFLRHERALCPGYAATLPECSPEAVGPWALPLAWQDALSPLAIPRPVSSPSVSVICSGPHSSSALQPFWANYREQVSVCSFFIWTPESSSLAPLAIWYPWSSCPNATYLFSPFCGYLEPGLLGTRAVIVLDPSWLLTFKWNTGTCWELVMGSKTSRVFARTLLESVINYLCFTIPDA